MGMNVINPNPYKVPPLLSPLLPIARHEEEENGEYLQTSDEHDEGRYPFGGGGQGGIASAGSPLSDRDAYVTDHRDGDAYCFVKTDTTTAEGGNDSQTTKGT